MRLTIPFDALASDAERAIIALRGRVTTRHTYAELAHDVESSVQRLVEWGVRPGDCVGLYGDNSYEWIIHDLALIRLGAISVCLPTEVVQSEPMAELAERFSLRLLICAGRADAVHAALPWRVDVTRRSDEHAPPALRECVTRPELHDPDVFSVVFSSGTTGKLKALVLSRAGIESTLAHVGEEWQVQRDDNVLVALPLSNLQQRIMVYCALIYGFNISLASPQDMFRALQEGRPTIIAGPPLLFEAFEKRFRAQPIWRQRALEWAARILGSGPAGELGRRAQRRLFKPMHDAFGGRARVMLVGSAPSKRGTLQLYARAGLPLYQAYGMTEAGFIAWNLPRSNRLGSVGKPVEPGSVKLAPDGEVVVRVRARQCRTYLDAPKDDVASTFLESGEIATGDLGHFDERGCLYLTGRKKDIIVTTGGYKIQPEPVERMLLAIAGVERAVLVGGGAMNHLALVVWLDPQLAASARAQREAEVRARVAKANRSEVSQRHVAQVLFAQGDVSVESGLLTRNLKINRQAVVQKFAKELLPTDMTTSRRREAL